METQKLLRQTTLVVLCILLLGAVALAALTAFATTTQEQAWTTNQQHVLSSIIQTRSSNLSKVAAEFASRGDFLESYRRDGGSSNSPADALSDIFDVSFAGISSPAGDILHLVERQTDRNTDIRNSHHFSVSSTDTLTVIDGRPGFWATASMKNSRSGNRLFLFSPIDENLVRELSAGADIRSLKIVMPDAYSKSANEISLGLLSAQSKPIAYLVWPREYPGAEMASGVLQPVLIILAIMIVLTHFVIKRTQIVADRFDGVNRREMERSTRIREMSQYALGLIGQENVNLEEGDIARKITERLADGVGCDIASYWRLSGGDGIFYAVDVYQTASRGHLAGGNLDPDTSSFLSLALSEKHTLMNCNLASSPLATETMPPGHDPGSVSSALITGIFLDGHIAGFIVAASFKERGWMEEENGYVGRLADIAALWVEAHQRQKAQESAILARDAAERANQAKGEFLAKMSHELRTPLNSIIGFADIMANTTPGTIEDTYRGYAFDIRESGRHLLAIINDILDTARLEHGSFEISRQPVDLLQSAVTVRRIMSGRAAETGIEIDISIPADLPILNADERRLRQILINLISNSIKFSRRGGRVSISAETDGSMAWIEISDNGIGMTEEEIAVALEPFRQVDNGLDRKHEGTGLGLPITKGLVALHGGEFVIISRPGEGTTVRFSIPILRDESHQDGQVERGSDREQHE